MIELYDAISLLRFVVDVVNHIEDLAYHAPGNRERVLFHWLSRCLVLLLARDDDG